MYSQWPTFPGRIGVLGERAQHVRRRQPEARRVPAQGHHRRRRAERVPRGHRRSRQQRLPGLSSTSSATCRPATGDFNENSVADGNDFLAWQRGLGTTVGATRAQGNADFDADVDAADLGVWRAQYGLNTAAAAPAVVPEFAAVLAPQADDKSGLGLSGAPATDLVDLIHGLASTAPSSRRAASPRPEQRAAFAASGDSGSEAPQAATTTSAWDDLGDDAPGDEQSTDDAFESLGAGLGDLL